MNDERNRNGEADDTVMLGAIKSSSEDQDLPCDAVGVVVEVAHRNILHD